MMAPQRRSSPWWKTDGKVAFIDVLPGRNLGPRIELTSGALKPDSQVIVSPNAMLRAGDATPLAIAGK